MKVIITFASAGSGHQKAAEAIYNYFRKTGNGTGVEIVDVLEKTNFLFRLIYSRGYFFLVNHASFLWALGYKATESSSLNIFGRFLHFVLNRACLKRYNRYLLNENPDVIISTHFLPTEISGHLKKSGKIKARIITVITDYGTHPLWLSKYTDLYIVACDAEKKELIQQGIAENNIRAWGIPIDGKFLKPLDKDFLKEKFGIDKQRFTVLLVTGSFGLGPIEQISDNLKKEAQLLVVCAKNKKLYSRLSKKYKNSEIKIFGFVDFIHELMSVSDLIITKPGGLTIAEVLSMELVPVFVSPIPGQETRNLEILKEYGIGIEGGNMSDIKNIIRSFREHPEKLQAVREKIKKLKKTDSAERIYNAVCESGAWPAD